MAGLSRALNSLALLVVCAVLLFVLYWEFMRGEFPGALGLLHENVRRYGTVFNTVAPGTRLSGVLRARTRN